MTVTVTSGFPNRGSLYLIQSLQLVHLVWPSWWKMHVYSSINHFRYRNGGSTLIRHQEFWTPPQPDHSLAKAEWEELWQSFSRIGVVKRLHVTMFQVRSMVDALNVFSVDELLPALCNVRAKEFFVEVWGNEARIEEPSAERPFWLHYNPALRGQGP
jgi:hypothetical protein